MAPDLNSLPTAMSSDTSPSASHSRSLSNGDPPSPSPRSTSLAAAATINAGIQNQQQQQQQSSRRSSTSSGRTRGSPVATASASAATGRAVERHRSNVAMNLSLNDSALPGPGEMQTSSGAAVGTASGGILGGTSGGEGGGGAGPGSTGIPMRRPSQHGFRTASPRQHSASRSPVLHSSTGGDPHHQRAPSIGELHQELEQEQEAQVNRLLQTIRLQQIQLQQLQSQVPGGPASSTGGPAVEDTPTSERSFHFAGGAANTPAPVPVSGAGPRTHSPAPRISTSRSRRSSTGPGSPAVRARSSSLRQQAEELALATTMSGGSVGGVGGASRDEAAFYQAEAQSLTRENQMLRQRIRELERQAHERTSTSQTVPSTSSALAAEPMEAEGEGGAAAPSAGASSAMET